MTAGVSAPRYNGTIALVGDSHLTDTSSRSVLKLGPRLRRCGWDVTTYAAGGRTTRAALNEPAPQRQYDWTIYCFGSNDAATWKVVPLAEFSRNLEALVLRCPGGRVILGPPPVSAAVEASGRTQRLIEEYSAAAADVAATCAAAFVGLVDLLGEDDLAEDGVHVNDQGYEKIELALADVLRPRSR